MERYCYICGYSFALLIPIIHNQYLAMQISSLFDLVVENGRAAFFVCHQCKEIVTNMYEFYLHIKKTQSFVSGLTDEQKRIYCRMCGCCYEDLHSLFDLSLLVDKIYKLYKVKITKEDKLPTVICEPCKEIISNNWNLYIQMYKGQEIFPNEQPTNLEFCNEESDTASADISVISIPESRAFQEPSNLNSDKSISKNHKTAFVSLPGKEIQKAKSLQGKTKEVAEKDTSDKKIESSSKHMNIKKGCSTEEHSAPNVNTKKINEIVKNYDTLVINDLLKHPRCDICKSLSTDTVELHKHYNSFHDETPWCETEKFCKLFSMYRYIIENRRRPELLRDINGEEVWSCMCCTDHFKSKLKMFHHERHAFLKKFQNIQCGLCSRLFFSKTCYNYHKILHMKLVNFKCEKCNKSFLFVEDLHTHMRAHKDQFANTCPICELDFETPWTFQEHYIMHTLTYKSKPHPFYCGLCGLGYATKELTGAHLATHILKENGKSFL